MNGMLCVKSCVGCLYSRLGDGSPLERIQNTHTLPRFTRHHIFKVKKECLYYRFIVVSPLFSFSFSSVSKSG